MAYELIETIEVGAGGAASIEFTSIPQDGVDLLLVLSTRTDRGFDQDAPQLTFNSDTGSNYSNLYLQGTGSSASSTSYTHTSLRFDYTNASTSTGNTFGNAQLYVSNYTSGSAKSVSCDTVMENNATLGYQTLWANSWSGTSAISSIQISSATSSNFVQYSTASLYKIY